MCVAMDGPRCTCGSLGCLETYIAGWAIARDAQLVASTVDGKGILDAAEGKPIHAGVVGLAADRGDETARFLLNRAGQALGVAIGTLVNIFNPELVVIGGGVARLGDHLIGPARRRVNSHCFDAMRQDLRIVEATLGDDGGLYGAAALAIANLSSPASVA
jgi:glucokinase